MQPGSEPKNIAAVKRACQQLAAAQGGVVRREQLLALGLPPRTIRRQIAEGGWVPHGRSVLVAPLVEDGLLTRSLIAIQRIGSRAALTGPSALAARGLLGERPWQSVDLGRVPWIVADVHLRLPARLIRRPPGNSSVLLGVPVVPMKVAMLDLLRFLAPDDALGLALAAAGTMQWREYTEGLAREIERHRHEPGVAQLRWLVEELGTGARSHAERDAIALLRAADIEGWVANYRVRVFNRTSYVDIAFPAVRLAIEIDGRAYHGMDRFQSDRERQNLLVQAGWTVLRFTWEDITLRPDAMVAQIVAALQRLSA